MVFSMLAPSRCMRCARPPDRLCSRCASELFAPTLVARADFVGVRLAQVNRSTLRVVRAMKDGGETALLRVVLGAAGLDGLRVGLSNTRPGSILFVPVPSSHSSWRKRGFNLAREMAHWLASHCIEPALVSKSLEFVYEPRDQRGLGVRARARNVAGAMSVDATALESETARLQAVGQPVAVVICDDVVTTGSTLFEARRALLAAFTRAEAQPSISFFALAETLSKNDTQTAGRV